MAYEHGMGWLSDMNEAGVNKICLIIHSLEIGGMERVMYQLAVDFCERDKTKVDLILIGKKREVHYSLPPAVNVHRPAFRFNTMRRTIDTLKTIRFLRKKVREIDPDTVLSFGEYWNNLVLLSLWGLSYPVYISDRSEPGKDLGKVQNLFRELLYPTATGYIAQTEAAERICRSRGWNDNIRVIGNPIRKINTNGQLRRENIVLAVGRLIETKHFDQLIRMFVQIGNPDWKLLIVGGDAKNMKLSANLKDLIQELGAEESVYMEGEQKQIDSYYRRSKIFAFTSSSEGFPNVIGEAMSAGLPVVCYDCKAGPSDMISDGENGFLIPLFNRKEFKEKLSLLMLHSCLRDQIGEKAKDRIQLYRVDRIADRFYRFITDDI